MACHSPPSLPSTSLHGGWWCRRSDPEATLQAVQQRKPVCSCVGMGSPMAKVAQPGRCLASATHDRLARYRRPSTTREEDPERPPGDEQVRRATTQRGKTEDMKEHPRPMMQRRRQSRWRKRQRPPQQQTTPQRCDQQHQRPSSRRAEGFRKKGGRGRQAFRRASSKIPEANSCGTPKRQRPEHRLTNPSPRWERRFGTERLRSPREQALIFRPSGSRRVGYLDTASNRRC